ncbi:CHAD domain-containing protein [Sinomonas albida]|uniref:CHAD domain-containing protein n=1 Tax=Sinomonas albida TaxID=369942 RepID=UPI0010A7ABB1|nr:CHAD domain-containing protein [Sinomonas albida]
MDTATSAAAAIGGYVDHYLDKLLELIPAAASGDVEAIHDARAALRRVLSVHRGYGKSLFKAKGSRLKEARAVVRHLGAVRDPQVALGRLSQPPLPQDVASLPALRRALEDRADEGLARLHPKKLRRRAEGAAGALRLRDADFPNGAVAELLRQQWELCERLRLEAQAYSAGAARWTHLHAERKALKRLRYMAESLQAWASDGSARVAAGAEQRQEALGALNDCWQLELWLVGALRLKGVSEDDVVRLLGAEDGALSACDGDYRAVAAEPIRRPELPTA